MTEISLTSRSTLARPGTSSSTLFPSVSCVLSLSLSPPGIEGPGSVSPRVGVSAALPAPPPPPDSHRSDMEHFDLSKITIDGLEAMSSGSGGVLVPPNKGLVLSKDFTLEFLRSCSPSVQAKVFFESVQSIERFMLIVQSLIDVIANADKSHVILENPKHVVTVYEIMSTMEGEETSPPLPSPALTTAG